MMTGLLTVGALIARYPLVASGCALVERSVCCISNGWRCFLAAVVDPYKRPDSRIKKASVRRLSRQIPLYHRVVYLLFRYGIVEPLGF